MLLTLPLVPLFMILVGTYTRRRTQERRAALDLLATHFSTSSGACRPCAPSTAAPPRPRHRPGRRALPQGTMATLRVAFLSGAVLELAATLGVALVAVTVGVRLDDGGLGLQAALTVLILAPELYVPIRAVGTLYHPAPTGWRSPSGCCRCPSRCPIWPSPRGSPPPGRSVRGVGFAYPSRDARC